jgi:hypothetical protein
MERRTPTANEAAAMGIPRKRLENVTVNGQFLQY